MKLHINKSIRYLLVNFFISISFISSSFAGNSIIFMNSKCKDAYLYHFLNRSCYYGDKIGVQILLSEGADPNGKGYEKYSDCVIPIEYSSPLMMAVTGGDIKITQLLIESGADPNILEGEGITPLTEAVKNENIEIIDYLLKNGANPEIKGMIYKPIDIAIKKGNLKIIKLLNRKSKKEER